MDNRKLDYDISMPNTINNTWYPKIRKGLVLDNGLNANHDLEKGGLENSWVLNVGIDYSDLNNRDALYDSDDTDDDNANNDRYDRNDIGFIDFGVGTTRGTPKSWIIPKKVDKKSKSRFSLDRRKPMIMKVRSDRIIKSIDIFKNSEFQIIERGIRSSISFL